MQSFVPAEPIRIEPRMYRPSEVSSLLGIPLQSIYAWIKSNEIKATKLGSRFFISPSELARLLDCDR